MKIVTLIFILIIPSVLYSQDMKDTIRLEDLKMPVSPGFAILDLSPTTIESPTSPKMLGLQVLNYINSSNKGLPQNIAFEFSPYWIFRQPNETIYKYLGLPDAQSSNIVAGVFRKLSLSLAVYATDTLTHLAPNTSYLSFGLRTNIITLWGKSAEITAKKFLSSRNQLRQEILRRNPDIDLNTMRQQIDSAYAANTVNAFTVKPMLVVDGAFAYSQAFVDGDYKNKRFNRSGWWLNATINAPLSPQKKDNFFVIFYFRSLTDNVLSDTLHNQFTKQDATDLGIRAGYEKGRFQVSAEHINRNYRSDKSLNGYRTTGIIQFKVNDGLYLMGSFGKNFSQEHNLFTMLGINWGIGKQALTL